MESYEKLKAIDSILSAALVEIYTKHGVAVFQVDASYCISSADSGAKVDSMVSFCGNDLATGKPVEY